VPAGTVVRVDGAPLAAAQPSRTQPPIATGPDETLRSSTSSSSASIPRNWTSEITMVPDAAAALAGAASAPAATSAAREVRSLFIGPP
jgi:hypothetical protein